MASGPIDRYRTGIVDHFAAVAGRRLAPGVSVVAFDDRTSSTAVLYDLAPHALIACSPSLAERLAAIDGAPADQVFALTEQLGGDRSDGGLNHVWSDAAAVPATPAPADRIHWLDVTDDADIGLIAQLAAACTEDDLEEADIDLETPDPNVVVTLAEDGTVTSYASGRPFWAHAECDDIGVLVHPDHRRRGLGAAVVAEFVRRRASTCIQLYRHDVENLGSTAIARGVGFTFVHDVHAITFPD